MRSQRRKFLHLLLAATLSSCAAGVVAGLAAGLLAITATDQGVGLFAIVGVLALSPILAVVGGSMGVALTPAVLILCGPLWLAGGRFAQLRHLFAYILVTPVAVALIAIRRWAAGLPSLTNDDTLWAVLFVVAGFVATTTFRGTMIMLEKRRPVLS